MKKEDQIKALEARIAELEKSLARQSQPAQAEPEPVQIDSVERDYNGRPVVSPDAPSWEERMAERKRQREAEERADLAARTQGLPPGLWRDPCGIVRNAAGRVASSVAQEVAARARVDAALAEQHRASLGQEPERKLPKPKGR